MPPRCEVSFETLAPIRYEKIFFGGYYNKLPPIKKVIFNNPATIVLWSDDTKTVVKCGIYDPYDPEKGLAMCIAKKALGNKGNYYNEIRRWMK